MRVLSLGNAYPPHHLGGYEIIWQGLTQHLRATGHQTRVITTGHRRAGVPEGGEEPGVYRELDWYWRDHRWRRLGPRQTLRLEQANAGVLERHLREFQPDVVCWWALGGLSLGLIEHVRRAALPSVFFVLDPWLSYAPRHDLWMRAWSRLRPLRSAAERITGLPTRWTASKSDLWIFCSRSLYENSRADGLRVSGEILAPGVARELVGAPPEAEAPPWGWRMLYLGRVVEQKGVATAVQALAELPEEARLSIVGDGDVPYLNVLRDLASRLGVAERLRFMPAQPHERVLDLYRSADVVLFPVEWPEPFGLVPLEAMAAGRPVVASGRGGSGDYLRDAENALLFPAGDGGALAACVRRLAGDQSLREQLRRGGRETALQHSEDSFNAEAIKLIRRARESS